MLSEWVSVCWVVIGCSSNLVCPVLRTSYSCHCHGGGHCEDFVANCISLSLSVCEQGNCLFYIPHVRKVLLLCNGQSEASNQTISLFPY